METQVPGLVTFPRPHFIIVVSSNDNNNWIIIITTIMIIIKVLLKNICPPPPLHPPTLESYLSALQYHADVWLCWHVSRNNILSFYFLFWTKVQLMSKLFFSFLNNDFDFLEKPLTVLFSFIKMNSVFVHHFGEFITHQM